MTLAMAPLIILFELSILLARWVDRIRPAEEEEGEDGEDEDDDDPDGRGEGDGEPGGDGDGEDDDDPLAEYEDEHEHGAVVGNGHEGRAAGLTAAAEAVQHAAEAHDGAAAGVDGGGGAHHERDERRDAPKLKDRHDPGDLEPKD
jgi:hypothetical protein